MTAAGDIGSRRPETSAGDVEAVDILERATLETSAGDVRGLRLRGDVLSLSTSSGSVLADALQAPTELSAIWAGDVDIEGVTPDPSAARRIIARTSSGDVLVAAR